MDRSSRKKCALPRPDLAVMRAHQAKAVVVWFGHSVAGKLPQLSCWDVFVACFCPPGPIRPRASRPLPPVEIIDLRRHQMGPGPTV